MNTRRAPGRTAQPQSTAPCSPAFTSTRSACAGVGDQRSEVGAVRRAAGRADARTVPDGSRSTVDPRTSSPIGVAVGRERPHQLPLRHQGPPARRSRSARWRPARRSRRVAAHGQAHRRRQRVGERETRSQQQIHARTRAAPSSRTQQDERSAGNGGRRRRRGSGLEASRSAMVISEREGMPLSGSRFGAAWSRRGAARRADEAASFTRKTIAPVVRVRSAPGRRRGAPCHAAESRTRTWLRRPRSGSTPAGASRRARCGSRTRWCRRRR